MIPYQSPNTEIVVADAALFMPIDFPGRGALTQLFVSKTGAFTVAVYNRQMITAALAVNSITSDKAAELVTKINMAVPLAAKVGDPITVAGNTVVGYNTTHRITAISSDRKTIVTDQTWSADGTGGTAALAIPAAEQALYKVLDAQTAAGNVVNYQNDDGKPYANADPKDHDGSTHKRLLYLKFSATGTYRVVVGAILPETFQF